MAEVKQGELEKRDSVEGYLEGLEAETICNVTRGRDVKVVFRETRATRGQVDHNL